MSSAKMQPRYGGNNLPATQSNTNCTPILWCGRNQFAKMYGTWTSVTAEGDRRSSEGRVDWDVTNDNKEDEDIEDDDKENDEKENDDKENDDKENDDVHQSITKHRRRMKS